MDLNQLFEAQRLLDAEIEKKHPTAPEEDRLTKRILALQVELGELANEWRGFKFWSVNQSPKSIDSSCPAEKAEYYLCGVGHEKYSLADVYNHGDYCYKHATDLMPMKRRNLLLEEYVDCLHFILSIGLQLGFDKQPISGHIAIPKDHIDYQFLEVTNYVMEMHYARDFQGFSNLIHSFSTLGEMLGFTAIQVESAYYAKNEINWKRQEEAY